MFSAISWGDYFAWTGGLLCCYYAGVAALFYRPEIKAFLLRAGKDKPSADTGEASPEDISEISSRVIDEIHSILQEAGQGASKPDLLKRINSVLVNYGGLRIPAYRSAMYDYIIREGKTICGVGISVAELEG